jgi:hypothetical protein
MQNLSGKSMVVLCTSCRIFHNESKKIRFAFFWFSCDFLRIFKVSGDDSRSEVAGAKGTDGSHLEAVGIEPARMPRRRSGLRAAQPSQQGARRAGGALEHSWSVFQPVNPTLTARISKKLNCATKTVDTKVVDETYLYNICKDCPMFFSTVWAGTPSKVWVLQSTDE